MSTASAPSHSQSMRVIKDHSQKLLVTHFYFPILCRHSHFESKWEVANAALGQNTLNADTLPLFLEAVAEFDFLQIRAFATDFPTIITQIMVDEEENNRFFASRYQNIKPVFEKYAPTSSELQSTRNSLQSFARLLYPDLAEMEKAWRYVESIISQSQDAASKIRGHMTGGSIGGILGSFVLPGVGTIAGAALGGYLMQKSRNSGHMEKINWQLSQYCHHVRHIIGLLHGNAKELYMIGDRLVDLTMTNRLRNTYRAVQAQQGPADSFLFEYLSAELLSLEQTYPKNFLNYEDVTTADAVAYVEQFLSKEYTS